MSDLLSVQEAATLLRCSEDTIRRRLRAGTLRYTRKNPGEPNTLKGLER